MKLDKLTKSNLIKTLIKLKKYYDLNYSYLYFPLYLNNNIRFYSTYVKNSTIINTYYYYKDYAYIEEEKNIKILNNNILIAELAYPGYYNKKFIKSNKIEEKYEYVCCLLLMENIVKGIYGSR